VSDLGETAGAQPRSGEHLRVLWIGHISWPIGCEHDRSAGMDSKQMQRGPAEEFRGAELGDRRRGERLLRIAARLGQDPSIGFPQVLESEAELEAFYRFINNDGFDAQAVLMPHVNATFARAGQVQRVIAVHDTTHVTYSGAGARRGLGVTTTGQQGFVGHFALLLTEDEAVPLGVAHLETLTRSGKKRRLRGTDTNKVIRKDPHRESLRWARSVESIEQRRAGAFEVIHVTDAEGDFFELLARLSASHARFVIRAGQLDRIVQHGHSERRLREVIDAVSPQAHRDVTLSARRYREGSKGLNTRKKHPERAQRMARLSMGSTSVSVQKTRYSDVRAEPFALNVVRVWERTPAKGESPVEWVLFTSEDVSSKAALERVVDVYRRRWVIEEYFKALKTGCALEKRQVESYEGLRKVLALFAPIAYRLLFLRAMDRVAPAATALNAFTKTDLHLMAHAPSNRALSPPTSVADALRHLARLGGHLKNNGPPGWLTLGRGYEKLLILRLGWSLAFQAMGRSDQS
jgi:hypothetical protein